MSGFVFSEKPIEIVSGEGPYLYDDDGREYLDVGASYACVPLGHGHKAVGRAVREQLDELTFIQASYPVAARTALYDLLAETAPGDAGNVWLCNSGAEANEAALKFARAATGRSKIVATMQGFHGRTMGALATTWKDKYKRPYEPLIGDVEFVPYNDPAAMADAVDEETAAVIIEPIQGEGGINPGTREFLQTARVETATNGAALVMDEVQTGLGRTGRLWASDRVDVVPDMLTAAKGLGNGLPIGATLCRDWVAEAHGSHGSTFSGGPVVSAAAGATVSTLLEAELPAQAADVGAYLRDRLAELENARAVRGEGLMIGIEVGRGANGILRELALEHGLLALPAGRTVVRLLPPLTITREHADQAVAALAAVIDG